MDKLYILDASGYLYRSYFAIPSMTNGKGESTNALFGFIRSVLKLMKDFQPEHLAAVFDGPSSTRFRTEMYADYKTHRKETPKDLLYQISWAQQACRLMGIPELMVPEVEADDTMGSVAQWAAEQGASVYLCTSDKDMCQLVTDHIFILNTFKKNEILGPQEVQQKFGVAPSQIVDFLALTGDASDNIPGVLGFGPKTAADLLQQFGTLESLLARASEIPGKKKQEALLREQENALLSRRLATIHTGVPFVKEGAFFKLSPPELAHLREFYSYMHFSSLLRELEAQQKRPFSGADKGEDPSYHLIDDLESLKALIHRLSQEKTIGIDTETTSIHPMQSQLVGIGLGSPARMAWYIPLNGKLDREQVLSMLKPLFENPEIGFYGHNLKYDYHVLLNCGIKMAHICFDTMLASYLLNSHSRQHSLDHLSLEIFGKLKIPIHSLIGKGERQITMQEVPLEAACTYCCEDVDYTERLREVFSPQLKERGLNHLFYALELPLLPVLASMERRGIFVDAALLKQLSAAFNQESALVKEKIYSLAGETFNLNSPKQISHILFDKLGIHVPQKSASDRSTNAEVLESLQSAHPIAAQLLEYRSLEKLRSTYLEALLKAIHPSTGRIHCTFNQSVVATGRLSCQDPNLQNIPVRTEAGRKIREAFRPQWPGWSYLSADYSQIELRILAHLSEDPILIQAFLDGEDIHTFTASQIFNVPVERVSKEQRHAAKAVNFGILYGQQAFGLSQQLGIEMTTAAAFIRTYFERYHKIKEFLEASKNQARETGKIATLLGRERLLPEIHSPNAHIRAMAERFAINTPIQGTQADLIKKAMLEIDHKLAERKLKAAMILQIHDELLFEVPDQELEEVGKLVAEAMTGVISLKVPLAVDITIGKNWKECYSASHMTLYVKTAPKPRD